MTLQIVLFGGFIFCAGVLILINPEIVFGILKKHSEKFELHVLAVVVRLVLGVLFLYQADLSKYPHVIEVLGWIMIVAAIVLAVMGRNNFKKLMNWAITLQNPLGRFAGLMAIAFGGFIIYAFV